jgi:hypothetical protein
MAQKKTKRAFKRAYLQLKGKDSRIVQDVICKRNSWASLQLWSYKMKGDRGLTIEEQDIVESTFRNFGIDAWSGEPIKELSTV